jgi:hypothetical protein
VALRNAEKCKIHLDQIASVLPETTQRPGGEKGLHVAYMVRKKTFAYFTVDHHGDGRLALTFRAPHGDQAALIASAPDRSFVPPYLGHRGWAGLWLDVTAIDWSEVQKIMIDAFRLAAPSVSAFSDTVQPSAVLFYFMSLPPDGPQVSSCCEN